MFTEKQIETLVHNAKCADPLFVVESFQAVALSDLEACKSALACVPTPFIVKAVDDASPLERLVLTVRNLADAIRVRGTLFDEPGKAEVAGRPWSEIAQRAYETYRLNVGSQSSKMEWDALHGAAKNAWEAAVRQAADGSAPESWIGWQSSARYHKDIRDAEPGNVFETANGRVVQMHAHSKEPALYMLGETIEAAKTDDVQIIKYLRNGVPCANHGHEWRIIGRRLDLEF